MISISMFLAAFAAAYIYLVAPNTGAPCNSPEILHEPEASKQTAEAGK